MAEREESDVCRSSSQGECDFNTQKKTFFHQNICLLISRINTGFIRPTVKNKTKTMSGEFIRRRSLEREPDGHGNRIRPWKSLLLTTNLSECHLNVHFVSTFHDIATFFYYSVNPHPGFLLKLSSNLKHLFEFCLCCYTVREQTVDRKHSTGDRFKCLFI